MAQFRVVAGKFAASPGSASCDSCDKGQFNSGGSQVGCSACPAGQVRSLLRGGISHSTLQFQNATGQAFCYKCPAGQFQPNQQRSTCLPCKSTSRTESHHVRSLVQAKLVATHRSTASLVARSATGLSLAAISLLTQCWFHSGHYAPSPSSTICSGCVAGTFSVKNATDGASSCTNWCSNTQCASVAEPVMSSQPAWNVQQRTGCRLHALCVTKHAVQLISLCSGDAGKFTNSTTYGLGACFPCPKGTFAPKGSSFCQQCAPVRKSRCSPNRSPPPLTGPIR